MQAKTAHSVKFIFFFFALYLLLSQGNLFMNSVLSTGGKFYNDFLFQNLNYIQWLRSALIIPATWILEIFGYNTLSNQTNILVIGGPNLNVNYSCLGLGVMSFIISFIVAFPSKDPKRWQTILKLSMTVFLLNVFRIVTLGIIFTEFQNQRKNFIYHHEIFNAIIYVVVLFLLFRWLKNYYIKDN